MAGLGLPLSRHTHRQLFAYARAYTRATLAYMRYEYLRRSFPYTSFDRSFYTSSSNFSQNPYTVYIIISYSSSSAYIDVLPYA